MNKENGVSSSQSAASPAFLGESEGVSVAHVEGVGFQVAFPFDRQLLAMMDRVPGAAYDKGLKAFQVPLSSFGVLSKVVDAMRLESSEVAAAYDNIVDLASASGVSAQQAGGAELDVMPQVNNYREPGKFYGGEITNVNSYFAAQFTGLGKQDNAAFMAVHRLADLDGQLVEGDVVGIVYDDRFNGVVKALSQSKSAAVLADEFQANAGLMVDGVTVSDRGDKIGLAFDINPVMVARIRRVEGAAFNKADKVWEVPKERQEFALFAAQDLRSEFVLDAKEIASMRDLAAKKMDGAKVWNAFTKDGAEHFGKILGVGTRYALQKTGRENFALHHLSSLSERPIAEHDTAISYNKGVGSVVDLDLRRAQNVVLGTSR